MAHFDRFKVYKSVHTDKTSIILVMLTSGGHYLSDREAELRLLGVHDKIWAQ